MIAQLVFVAALALPGEMPVEEKKVATVVEQEDAELELTEIETDMLEQTNQQRSQRGLAPLVIDPTLVESAREHAIWMTANRTMQHTWKGVGENIAQGQNTVDQVMNT